MVSYKVVEEVGDKSGLYSSLFYRGLIYEIGKSYLTFCKAGIFSYTTLEAAKGFIHTFTTTQASSLVEVGCHPEEVKYYIKSLAILECEFPEEAVVAVEGTVIQTKVIIIKQLVGG